TGHPSLVLNFGGSIDLSNRGLNLITRVRTNLQSLDQLFPGFHGLGSLNATYIIGGKLSSPSIEGTLKIQDGSFHSPAFPFDIDVDQCSARLKENRVELDHFSAQAGGGTVEAGGAIALNQHTQQSSELWMRVRHL